MDHLIAPKVGPFRQIARKETFFKLRMGAKTASTSRTKKRLTSILSSKRIEELFNHNEEDECNQLRYHYNDSVKQLPFSDSSYVITEK